MIRFPRLRVLLDSKSSLQNQAAMADPPEAANVESDLVVIMASMLCALICMIGLIAVLRCDRLRTHGNRNSSLQQQHALSNKGLKKKILKSLPKYNYSASVKASDKEANFSWTECAICLSEFVEGEELRVLPQCNHAFHVACVDMWLGSHSSCPSCRQMLVVASNCREFSAGGGSGAALTECERPHTQLNVKEEDSIINHINASYNCSFLP
ncbi:hypothetical protein K2173_005044 [Erythroxylum novogranatense]|uniref:RING-type E3 ubiquitin transferase n=1 Tax=Erythroxylum novogranatense TaxID=1862640 RepID=A0AAV8TCZ4_9ROSI|nr:hypothetical protein K2173_005044 [Erythroxylum novogranatense]